MSSFICEKCGAEILDSPQGYITGCAHYPRESRAKKSKNTNVIDQIANFFKVADKKKQLRRSE